MLVEMAMGIHSCRMMLYHAAWKISQRQDVSQETAMVKIATSETWSKCADYAVQIHGGMGVMEESIISKQYQMSRVARIGEGTSEIQKILLARQILR
jgi:acyl-CoA dehydrogenase